MISKAKMALFSGIFVTTAIAVGAVLTKAGYLPNFFGISFLKSERELREERIVDECEKKCEEDNKNNSHIACWLHCTPIGKPVIYLYPEKTQETLVRLDFDGDIVADEPKYDANLRGWLVTAHPDGTLVNRADGEKYDSLFWEGIPRGKINWDFSTGFVVMGKETRAFLQNTLKDIGLSQKESDAFLEYWLPRMEKNSYNLIHFAGAEYTEAAQLTISPEPDSVLRVLMVFQPLDHFVKIPEQRLSNFERTGFVVVEWGGIELR